MTPRETEVATLTIRDVPTLTPTIREDIANWLRRKAEDIEDEGDEFSGTFIARYYVTNRD